MTRNSKISKKLLAGVLGLGAAFTLAACESPESASTAPGNESPVAESPVAESPVAATDTSGNVVEVAANNPEFSTLAQAIEAANLSNTLAQDGPYTVFAPTNEAFESLPPGTLEALLLPENQDILTQVLSYHVVPQELTSQAITPGEVETVAGEPVSVQADQTAGEVTVNEAQVVDPDMEASNGVIHGIDQVLLPPGVDLAQLQTEASPSPQAQ